MMDPPAARAEAGDLRVRARLLTSVSADERVNSSPIAIWAKIAVDRSFIPMWAALRAAMHPGGERDANDHTLG
jgi:hypothetical protein